MTTDQSPPLSDSTADTQKSCEASDARAQITQFDLVAFLTLFAVLVVSHTLPYQALTIGCTIAAGLSHRLRRSAWLWILLASAFAPRLIFDWYHNEDHVYLAIYWCLAVGLSRWGQASDQVLSVNARWLTGLAFGFAVFWKITTPQFLDGSLCTYKLVNDYRFRQVVTQPILGLTDRHVEANVTALVSLRQTGSPLTTVRLQYPDIVVTAGRLLAVWTIVIEGAIALLFLLPERWVRIQLRHVSLLLFALSTYLVVPVLGFATLFVTMGIAQTERNQRSLRWAYLATIGIIALRFGFPSSVFGFRF